MAGEAYCSFQIYKISHYFREPTQALRADHPWIVFTTDRKMKATGWRLMHQSRYHLKQGDNASIFDIDCIVPLDPRADKFRVGKAFHEAFKEANDKSKIYTALMDASKAAHYFATDIRHLFPILILQVKVNYRSIFPS